MTDLIGIIAANDSSLSTQVGIVASNGPFYRVVPINQIIMRDNLIVGDVTDLKASIKTVGLLNPVTLTEDMRLIAGARRIAAYLALGRTEIEAIITSIEGLVAELAGIDENIVRKQLPALEYSDVMARRKELYEAINPSSTKKAKALQNLNGQSEIVSFPSFTDDTANKTGKTQRSIQQAVQISNNIGTDVKELLRGTQADSMQDLLRVSRMSADQQHAVAAKISNGEARNVKFAVKLLRHDKLATDIPFAEGDKKYSIIYADPPWSYDIQTDRTPDNHYPTMPLDLICQLPVNQIAADDSALFLWSTNPLLPEALEVMKAWGYTYVTQICWDKIRTVLGYWVRGQHELLLIGRKGNIVLPMEKPASMIRRKCGRHSAKPDGVYNIIERMFPSGKRIELFARKRRVGWHQWGNEVMPGEYKSEQFSCPNFWLDGIEREVELNFAA